MIFVQRYTHLSGNLFVRDRTSKLSLKFCIGSFQIASLFPQRTGSPVKGSEIVKNCAADSSTSIGREFDSTFRLEFLDGINQTDYARADQIIHFNAGR